MNLLETRRWLLAPALCVVGSLSSTPAATGQETLPVVPESQSAADAILALTRDGRMPTATALLETLAAAPTGETLSVLRALDSTELLPGAPMRAQLADSLLLVPELVFERKRAGKETAAEVRCALLLLEQIGDYGDVKLMLDLVAPSEEASELDRNTVATLKTSLGPLLDRDIRAYEIVERQLPRVHDVLAPTLISIIGARRSDPGLEVLIAWLAHGAVHERLLLSYINSTAAKVDPVLEESALLRVRMLLSSNDESIRREAALAVGRLNDYDSLPELVALVEKDTRSVRDNAHWSLKRLTKLNVRPVRWKSWYESEHAWWRDKAPALLNALSLESPADLIPAITELSQHRLFRNELAFELGQLLHNANPSIVRLTCSALESLQCQTSVAALIPVIDHADESVRQQACAALRTITGRDLPCARSAWEQADL